MNDNVNKQEQAVDPIVREVGERVIIDQGRDYIAPTIRVVCNTFEHATDDEKALYISQGKSGISISLTSLQAAINWAKGG
jgi:hypothetical protein